MIVSARNRQRRDRIRPAVIGLDRGGGCSAAEAAVSVAAAAARAGIDPARFLMIIPSPHALADAIGEVGCVHKPQVLPAAVSPISLASTIL